MEDFLKQFVGVTAIVMAATQWGSFKVNKRLMTMIYAVVFSFTAYLLGFISLPETMVVDDAWAKYFVVFVSAIASAILATGVHTLSPTNDK